MFMYTAIKRLKYFCIYNVILTVNTYIVLRLTNLQYDSAVYKYFFSDGIVLGWHRRVTCYHEFST